MLRSTSSAVALAAIYNEHVNLAEWRRELSATVQGYGAALIEQYPGYCLRQAFPVSIDTSTLMEKLPRLEGNFDQSRQAFAEDLSLLCEMYACLFDLRQIGLRLTVQTRAMCPRFHVDQVVCRLICTYVGAGTEWLSATKNSRAALLIDGQSTIEPIKSDVHQLQEGSVALLKGEMWPGNEGYGLVHRSPEATPKNPRLVITLDSIA